MSVSLIRRLRPLLSALLAVGLIGSVAALPSAAKAQPDLTVMTRNIYLGSSLAPAIGIPPDAPDAGEQFIGAVAQIYATVLGTDFPARAQALAAEIAATEPDLVGLQEVSLWTATPVVNPEATPPSLDFLEILLATLEAAGLNYSVAGVSNNAEIGPLPLVSPPFGCVNVVLTPNGPVPDCVVSFEDRDVILVNDETDELNLGNAKSGTFKNQQVLATPAGPLSFDRGWVSVTGRYAGKRFTFVNTHLETEDFAGVQEAQTSEFLRGPARGGSVIAVGDFNSAADGSTTNSYAQLTAPPAFTDAWTKGSGAGLTCCQNATLSNADTIASSRIDLVLVRGPVLVSAAEVVGDTKFRDGPPPLWASDHAGVVATVKLR